MPGWISRLTLNQKLALGGGGARRRRALRRSVSREQGDARRQGTGAGRRHRGRPRRGARTGRVDHRGPGRLPARSTCAREAEFAQYHIPTAVNIPMNVLTDAGLGRQEKLVLYSEGGIHSAQAWMLLKAQGYKSRLHAEGRPRRVEGPGACSRSSPTTRRPAERARDERLTSISAFFGGQPRSAAAVAAGAAAMPGMARPRRRRLPKVAAPPSPAGGAKPAAPKKKKEGC